MALSTGTMSGKTIRFLPKSAIKSFEQRSRAVICLLWSITVSHKYNLYESPIQRSRDLMKSGFIPASSSKTTAHTLIEWEEKRKISFLVRSEWQVLAKDWRTSVILLPVRLCPDGWRRRPLVDHQIDRGTLLTGSFDMLHSPDRCDDSCCRQLKWWIVYFH
jgi:hypothetical protein